jgi:uncharacterized protein YkwD
MLHTRWLPFVLLLTTSCVGVVESDGERHKQGSGGSLGGAGATTTNGLARAGVGQGGASLTSGSVGSSGGATGVTTGAGGVTVGAGGVSVGAGTSVGAGGVSVGAGGAGGAAGSASTDAGAADHSASDAADGSPRGDAADGSRGPDSAIDAQDVAPIDAALDQGSQDVSSADSPIVGDPESGLLAGITRLHNVVRAEVGVPGLTWDPTIAATAQAYADKCIFQHSGAAGLGENLAAYAPPGGRTASAPVDDWASEKANYDYASNTCANGQVCGHYTQVVWKNSLRLGCGVQSCSTNSPFMGFPNWEIWVCNYAPPGNVGGERPY